MDEDYFVCDHCGAELPIDANFCPQCGSSEEDGWSEDDEDYVDDFDYDEFVADEFPDHAEPAPPTEQLRSAIVVVIILVICAALALATVFAF